MDTLITRVSSKISNYFQVNLEEGSEKKRVWLDAIRHIGYFGKNNMEELLSVDCRDLIPRIEEMQQYVESLDLTGILTKYDQYLALAIMGNRQFLLAEDHKVIDQDTHAEWRSGDSEIHMKDLSFNTKVEAVRMLRRLLHAEDGVLLYEYLEQVHYFGKGSEFTMFAKAQRARLSGDILKAVMTAAGIDFMLDVKETQEWLKRHEDFMEDIYMRVHPEAARILMKES